ncbi:helix-turn-helix domain-containing protein [Syntrophomonas erecta]
MAVVKRDLLRDGALIRGFRIGVQLTQADAAQLTGISIKKISRAERGLEKEPEVYLQIARELGLSESQLIIWSKIKKVG